MCDTLVVLCSAWKGSYHSKTDIIFVTSALPALLNNWLILLESRSARLFFLYSANTDTGNLL